MPMSLSLADHFRSRTEQFYDPLKEDADKSFFSSCVDWETQVETVLRGLQPNGLVELRRFRDTLGKNLPSNLSGRERSVRALKSSLLKENPRVKDVAKNRSAYIAQVDQTAKTVFDTVTVPGPGFNDNEYLNATGIICIGT